MSINLFDLTGKIAIVTGGGGLLAGEHAIALASYGANVILADINKEKCDAAVSLLLDQNIQATSKYCDVTDKESWQTLLHEVSGRYGKIDILINNAGFTNQSRSVHFDAGFENFPLEDWNAIMNVNLTGTFLGCQVIGRHMLENGKGSIINMASVYGVISPHHTIYKDTEISQPAAYTVSKHGVIGLTKYLATLWADKGVRVNAITPGGIFNEHKGLFLERFEQLNPVGKMSDKSELRGGVVYLASDASSHVVGHNLIIDGGWTVW
jgi:NAD(P)-dependent dehydrogenase (short-subunit alcohol dehydrogenase family)